MPERDRDAGRPRFRAAQWLAAAVIVQAMAIGAIGGSFLVRQAGDRTQPRYETLTSPESAATGSRIRAVFSESMTIGQLKTLLAAQRLLILSGPTESGVFTLGMSDTAPNTDQLDGVLAGLRASPQVLFAEPVHGDGVPTR